MPTNQSYTALKLVLVHSFSLGGFSLLILFQVATQKWFRAFINLLFFIFNIFVLKNIFKKEREALDKMLSV